MMAFGIVALALALASLFLSATGLKLVHNTSDEISLENQDGPNLVSFNISLQSGTLLTKLNASNASGTIDASVFGVLPYLILEHNATDGPVLLNAIEHTFLDFSLTNSAWGKGLDLFVHNDSVYVVEGLWVPDDEPRLRFQATMIVAAESTVFEGRSIEPNEIVMIFTILTNVPFRLNNSIIAFDQVLLTGTDQVTNSTTSDSFVFNSGNQTYLYINRTAYVDGKSEPINDDSLKVDKSIAGPAPPNATSLNLLGLTAQDVLLNFLNSGNSNNITFEQRLSFGPKSQAQQGAASRSSRPSLLSLFGALLLVLAVAYVV